MGKTICQEVNIIMTKEELKNATVFPMGEENTAFAQYYRL